MHIPGRHFFFDAEENQLNSRYCNSHYRFVCLFIYCSCQDQDREQKEILLHFLPNSPTSTCNS